MSASVDGVPVQVKGRRTSPHSDDTSAERHILQQLQLAGHIVERRPVGQVAEVPFLRTLVLRLKHRHERCVALAALIAALRHNVVAQAEFHAVRGIVPDDIVAVIAVWDEVRGAQRHTLRRLGHHAVLPVGGQELSVGVVGRIHADADAGILILDGQKAAPIYIVVVGRVAADTGISGDRQRIAVLKIFVVTTQLDAAAFVAAICACRIVGDLNVLKGQRPSC